MILIQKQPTPPDIQKKIDSLTSKAEWKKMGEKPGQADRQKIRKNYFNRLDKHRVREALIAEQKGLCAYCMAPIENDGEKTTIEHWYPLSMSKSLALDYQNYFAVCNGGRNDKIPDGEPRVTCCDAKKSNTIAVMDPRRKDLVDGIAYHSDGKIYTRYESKELNDQIQDEFENIFALNGKLIGKKRVDTTTRVVKRRRDTYRAMEDTLEEMMQAGMLNAEILEEKKAELLSNNPMDGFVGVSLFVLETYLKVLRSI